jgi:hypothetical protein
MKTQLYSKILTYDFKSLFEKKGYAFFTKGVYNLNIIGVRSNQNNNVTNKYDDYLVVDYETNNGHKRQVYTITTDPGSYYMNKPMNSKGTAILVPNQYRGAYKIDLHNGKYKALCQRNKPVQVYRDGNKDTKYDLLPEKTETGLFGINIHRSNQAYTRSTVDQYSAGCQVFNDPSEFASFMTLCNKAKDIWGNCFTYTLITEDDLV